MSKYPISELLEINHLPDYSSINLPPRILCALRAEIKREIIGHLSYERKLKCPWVFGDCGGIKLLWLDKVKAGEALADSVSAVISEALKSDVL